MHIARSRENQSWLGLARRAPMRSERVASQLQQTFEKRYISFILWNLNWMTPRAGYKWTWIPLFSVAITCWLPWIINSRSLAIRDILFGILLYFNPPWTEYEILWKHWNFYTAHVPEFKKCRRHRRRQWYCISIRASTRRLRGPGGSGPFAGRRASGASGPASPNWN